VSELVGSVGVIQWCVADPAQDMKSLPTHTRNIVGKVHGMLIEQAEIISIVGMRVTSQLLQKGRQIRRQTDRTSHGAEAGTSGSKPAFGRGKHDFLSHAISSSLNCCEAQTMYMPLKNQTAALPMLPTIQDRRNVYLIF
jgi:hypothetical protein